MDQTRAPKLPAGGKSSRLSTISQSLSFHASPHSFLNASWTDPDATPESSVPLAMRARILNRDVAIIVSYLHCREMLDAQESSQSSIVAAQVGQKLGPSSFGILPAYKELMADFFPQPNLLLLDAPGHKPRREAWEDHMANVKRDSSTMCREIAEHEISAWQPSDNFDLYDRMKDLAWKMLVALFLELRPPDPHYHDVVRWQEELLRGQFSLFPVSIKTPFWRSPRSRGLEARGKLQEALRERIDTMNPQCPFHCRDGNIPQDDLASNALLFTSSIAVKAVASLLTASLLNLYLFEREPSLVQRLRALNPEDRDILLRSILLETERLSPPVIGVMRRMQQDIVLQQQNDGAKEDPGTLVPTGWDAWLYFVNANRNESIYRDAHCFIPERFIDHDTPPSLTFGFGDKSCLGRDIARQIVRTVATVMIDTGVDLYGAIDSEGVRGWLGWDAQVSVDSMARDLKQLPCQRPRKPIKLRMSRTG